MNAESLDKTRKMKLMGMHRTFETDIESCQAGSYTPDDIIAHLVDATNGTIGRSLH